MKKSLVFFIAEEIEKEIEATPKWVLWLIIILLLTCLVAIAGPGTVKTNVTLTADYDTNAASADLSFNLYSTTNITLPIAQWPVVTNVLYPACMTNGTNVQIVLPISSGPHFYALTASNWWGESPFSNVTNAVVVTSGNNLRLRSGP